MTTQGMAEPQMETIADLITRTLQNRSDEGVVAAIRKEVADLCSRFRPYPD